MNVDIFFSFLVTWAIALLPPALIRLARRKPLQKIASVVIVVILYFTNHILLGLMGASRRYTNLLILGAMFAFFILRWQTKASADKQAAEERSKLGYDP